MSRRKFLKQAVVGSLYLTAASWQPLLAHSRRHQDTQSSRKQPSEPLEKAVIPREKPVVRTSPTKPTASPLARMDELDQATKDYFFRIRNPDRHFSGDIQATPEQRELLAKVARHLRRVQGSVGYGNFNVISLDEMIRFSRRYSRVGDFNRSELDFLEKIFYSDARQYGFMGEKVLTELTASIRQKEIKKIPRTGHYLFRGESLAFYEQLRKDFNNRLVLTSGVRGVVKQMYLFLRKAEGNNGNLSLASRSLAPPGYSFHGNGDFDVGRPGWGARNFSSDFAKTDEFRRLVELGYIDFRYPMDNRLGVRFEPWHIKIS